MRQPCQRNNEVHQYLLHLRREDAYRAGTGRSNIRDNYFLHIIFLSTYYNFTLNCIYFTFHYIYAIDEYYLVIRERQLAVCSYIEI